METLMEEVAKQEPPLEKILMDWNYTPEQIGNPLLVQSFKPKGDVVLTWLDKHTPKPVQIGWQQGDQVHPLLMTDSIMNIPTPLMTSDEDLGLFVIVKEEVETKFQLDDQIQNTRVYPLLNKGEVVDSSYIICWEVDGDGDFNDVIMRLVGVDVIQE
jgi:hypothetical protein